MDFVSAMRDCENGIKVQREGWRNWLSVGKGTEQPYWVNENNEIMAAYHPHFVDIAASDWQGRLDYIADKQ